MGDSSNSDEIIPLCGDGLDVLVHEATVEDALKDKAVENGHSTPSMAVELALKVRARKLVIFHLSPRYKPVGSETKEDEVTLRLSLTKLSPRSNGKRLTWKLWWLKILLKL